MAPSEDEQESGHTSNVETLLKIKENCIHYLQSKRFFLSATNIGGDKGILLANRSCQTIANELAKVAYPASISWVDCRDLGTLHKRFVNFYDCVVCFS